MKLTSLPFSAALFLSLGLAAQPADLVNEWTKPSSGSWEEPFWSLGLPTNGQPIVAFRNPGWKALAIGSETTARYASSLSVQNLIVDAPTDSYNQLLLNWAGLQVALTVSSNLTVGTNGSLANHNSALKAGTVLLNGSASFSDGATAEINQLTLDYGAFLTLNEGSVRLQDLDFLSGVVTQRSGMHVVSTVSLPAGRPTPYEGSGGRYELEGGVMASQDIVLGLVRAPFGVNGFGTFRQSSGVHTNAGLTLFGYYRPFVRVFTGAYDLTGGLLISSSVRSDGGLFIQRGGTNLIEELYLSGASYFLLAGGELVTSNATIAVQSYVGGEVIQSGGRHTVKTQLVIRDRFRLTGGDLNAANIDLEYGEFYLTGGAVSNWGVFAMSGSGELRVGQVTAHLGRLEISGTENTPARWFMNNDGFSPVLLQFDDSRQTQWSGRLSIQHWHPAHNRILFGTNSQGLTSEQLSRITFLNPLGWPAGNYGATLRPNGELVPPGAEQAGGFTFLRTNGQATVTGYTGQNLDLTIPETIDGLPVTSIGDYAFAETALSSVKIGNNVTSIGNNAFYRCPNLASVDFGRSVTNIGSMAFYACTNLPRLTLPNSVVSLGAWAFYNCTGLADAVLGDGLMAIQDYALAECASLTNVVIGSSVSRIELFSFWGSSNLLAVAVSPLNTSLSSQDGVLFNKSQDTLLLHPPGRSGSYRIPDSVTTIADLAFYNNQRLTSVTLPSSVRRIRPEAFSGCTGLESVVIPEGVAAIGDNAFANCSRLAQVTFAAGLADIGRGAFQYCYSLTEVTIPSTVANIGDWAFAQCTNLAAVHFYGNAPQATYGTLYGSSATVYYLPGTTGWSEEFGSRPTAVWRLPYPMILNFRPIVQSGQFRFTISWESNALVVVEARTDLFSGSWQPVSTNTLSNGSAYFSDPQTSNYTWRFYRLRSL